MAHKRLRSDEERERRAGGAPAAPEHPLLELQRGAGNQAVSSMLARSPDTKEKEKGKGKEAAETGSRATVPGVGIVPLESVQWEVSRPTTTPRGREDKEDKKKGGSIVLTSKVGEHSSLLFKASLDGKPMTVEVVIVGSRGSVKLTLKGAIISSFSMSQDHESWTLNFDDAEQGFEGAQGEAPAD